MAGNDEPEPTTWFGIQSKKIQKDAKDFHLEDCTECRYVGGTSLILVGGYVAFAGRRRAAMRGGGVIARLPSSFFAGVLVSLGIMRLMGRNPFTSGDSEVGIDMYRKIFPKKDLRDSSTETRDIGT